MFFIGSNVWNYSKSHDHQASGTAGRHAGQELHFIYHSKSEIEKKKPSILYSSSTAVHIKVFSSLRNKNNKYQEQRAGGEAIIPL